MARDISKKALSGSSNGKLIAVGLTPTSIHITPPNLEYSEIWLYVINRAEHPIPITLRINGENIVILQAPTTLPRDLYGGIGAITYSGDVFEAFCDEPDFVFVGGWVYESEKKNA